jgi:hypothetical protein
MAGYVVQGRVAPCAAGAEVLLQTGQGETRLATDAEGRFRTVVDIFGTGGGERLAQRHGFPVLGRVPLDPVVRVGGDAGDPVVISHPASALSGAFREIAGRLAQRVAIRSLQALPILQ